MQVLNKRILGFLKNQTYSIGVDIGYDGLKLAQLANDGKGMVLVAGNSKARPENMPPGSTGWQRWAIETLRLFTTYGDFHGKEVIAAMPSNDVFIDHIKMPKTDGSNVRDAIFKKIKQKLPFEALQESTVMQYIPTEEDNVLVMATDRTIVDRHLAIYEKAGLSIKSIGVWPLTLTNCYTRFFGRRQSDLEAVVMLICIERDCTNIVICRHKKLLLARSIPIGSDRLDDEQVVTRLVMELTACKRQFGLMYRKPQIERLIFLAGQSINKEACATIARQLEMPAQIGDCLAAVEIDKSCRLARDESDADTASDPDAIGNQIDRRANYLNWTVAFGLSLW